MKVISGVAPGTSRLAKFQFELSRKARQRLKWFDYYHAHGHNGRLTCRYFGISPETFYRWKRRYDPRHLESLEDRPCRPKRVRQPTYSVDLVTAVQELREEYPRWGKDKLVVLVHRQGFKCSTSMVGRILSRLRRRGVLKEVVRNHISARRRRLSRPYGIRKPKEYPIGQPGDLIQLDTLDVRPLPGVVLKHFTARDIISRWDVVNIYSPDLSGCRRNRHRATASTASGFLDDIPIKMRDAEEIGIERRMPFPISALQVDGGPEFEAQFEEECQRRCLQLFILPPRSPKLNGYVERAHRTHIEEFYEVTDADLSASR